MQIDPHTALQLAYGRQHDLLGDRNRRVIRFRPLTRAAATLFGSAPSSAAPATSTTLPPASPESTGRGGSTIRSNGKIAAGAAE